MRHNGAEQSVSRFSATGGLEITALDETALRAATAGFRPAHCLKIAVLDEATLAAAIAIGGATVGPSIAVLNEAALSRPGFALRPSNARSTLGSRIPVLNEPALSGVAVRLGTTPCLQIPALDEAALH